MKNKIIHYVLPTNNPDDFFKNVLGKIDMYLPIKEFISFGINFQEPWTQGQIDYVKKTFDFHGIDLYYTFNDYNKDSYRFPLVKLRDDAARLNPTARYYCSIDDDIEYTCDTDTYCKIICNAIQYCEKYHVGTFVIGQAVEKNERRPDDGTIMIQHKAPWTAYGLILRNIYNGRILPENMVEKWGCQEDNTEGIYRKLYSGYGCACSCVNIANHTDEKGKDKIIRKRLNLSEHRFIPGTLTYWLIHGDSFAETNHYELSKEYNKYLHYPEKKIDFKKDLKIQIDEIRELYDRKIMDISLCSPIKQKYNLIHYILPTNKPEEVFKNLIPNLHMFKPISDMISFGINFQSPWTVDQIEEVIKKFEDAGITLFYEFNKYELLPKKFPITRIRNDSAKMNPTARYFCMVDDDIQYDCTPIKYLRTILQTVIFMETSKVGSVCIGQPVIPEKIKEYDNNIHHFNGSTWTCQGLLLRNCYDGNLVPLDAINCVGGMEDGLVSETRLRLNGLDKAYCNVFIGHHVDIKPREEGSMSRLGLRGYMYDPGTCGEYIVKLKSKAPIKERKIDDFKVDLNANAFDLLRATRDLTIKK